MKTEEYLKNRLLYNDLGDIFTPMDELISFVKMFTKMKCEEQRQLTLNNIEFTFNRSNEINGIDLNSYECKIVDL